MKEGWVVKPLGEVLTLEYGRPLDAKLRVKDGAYSVFGANGEISRSNSYYHVKPSIVVGRKGSVGALKLTDSRFWPLDVTYFVVFDADKYDLRFLFFLLEILKLPKLAKGVKPGLNRNDVYAINAGFPSLTEQQRIVAKLDEAFEAIASAKAKAEQNLLNARALFDSYLDGVFSNRGEGWVERRLVDLTTKIGSGATPLGGQDSYKADGISLIRSLNVHDGGFRYEKLAFIGEEQAKGLANVTIEQNDVLLNITGASVARCCVVPIDVLPARVNQHVSIIRAKSNLISCEFLHYALTSRSHKKKLLKIGDEGGSTRQAITKAQLQEYSLSYPAELSAQKEINDRVNLIREQTQALEAIYLQKINVLDELKQSLLHQAFSGEL